jgi:putative acyl-CoA dehydrogenase
MRQAVAQALHHTAHRSAFGRRLIEQPLMKNVLADLAVEVEAATVSMLRLARAYDDGRNDEQARVLTRLATAVLKYWICQRAPGHVYEALQCLGGSGYVEESIMPRLYREAPLSSIWEGSGNVICLDVLRAMRREPETLPALMDELALARGADQRLDAFIDGLYDELRDQANAELRARLITEKLALALQGALVVRHSPSYVAEAFCASRLAGRNHYLYGALPSGVEFDRIIARARPQVD